MILRMIITLQRSLANTEFHWIFGSPKVLIHSGKCRKKTVWPEDFFRVEELKKTGVLPKDVSICAALHKSHPTIVCLKMWVATKPGNTVELKKKRHSRSFQEEPILLLSRHIKSFTFMNTLVNLCQTKRMMILLPFFQASTSHWNVCFGHLSWTCPKPKYANAPLCTMHTCQMALFSDHYTREMNDSHCAQ